MAKKFRMKAAGGAPENTGAMGKPTGNGLAKKTLNSDTTVPSQSNDDYDDHNQLNDLANDLIENDFMSVVNDQGVEKKPQGVKTPGSSKPTDGHTKPIKSSLQNAIAEDMDNHSPNSARMNTIDRFGGQHSPSRQKTIDRFEGGSTQVGEEFKEGFPLPTVDYNDGQGMEVSTGGSDHGVNESDVGELTLEDAFDQYANDRDEINYDEFSGYTKDLGYDPPSNDDMMGLMSNDQHNLYEPTGMGGYARTPIMLTVNVEDLPGHGDDECCDYDDQSASPMPPVQPVLGGATDVGNDEDNTFANENEEMMEESEEVMEESVTTAQLASTPGMKPKIKKSTVKKAGNAATAVKGMKNMGKTMKRKMKNDDSSNVVKESKAGFILPTSIKENVSKIVKAVNEAVAKVPSASRSKLAYRVIVESKIDNKKVGTKRTSILNEAAVDAEELAVLGMASTHIEVALMESEKQTGVILVTLPKLNDRKPVINESGLLFRFKSLAQRYAASVIGESVAYRVEDHPFGALIKTDIKATKNLI